MRYLQMLLVVVLAGCNSNETQNTRATKKDTIVTQDTRTIHKEIGDSTKSDGSVAIVPKKIYANERFKEVTVEKTGDHTFLIKGKGQIFEANFNWVVEDGHEELKRGYTTTDAGAPEWGDFSFTIDAPKKRANSTLHLIIFELSAKDGSRQHELPILLY